MGKQRNGKKSESDKREWGSELHSVRPPRTWEKTTYHHMSHGLNETHTNSHFTSEHSLKSQNISHPPKNQHPFPQWNQHTPPPNSHNGKHTSSSLSNTTTPPVLRSTSTTSPPFTSTRSLLCLMKISACTIQIVVLSLWILRCNFKRLWVIRGEEEGTAWKGICCSIMF